jgi:hypothetical protein
MIGLRLHVAAIGLFGPGIAGWRQGRAILRGEAVPAAPCLPPFHRVRLPANEARRVTLSVRLALELAAEALDRQAAPGLAAVFACSGGNAQALARILASLDDHAVSPNQFAHVGHSAAAGYWSIATGQAAPATSIGAYDGSFAAGLLEAACQAVVEARPVLLVAADTPPPAALAGSRPVAAAFGVSLLLSVQPPAGGSPWIEPDPAAGATPDGQAEPVPGGEDRLADPALEALRRGNPAARCLPLLRLVALGRPGRVILPYLAGRPLVVHHGPC